MGFDDFVVGHIEWIARLAFRFHPRKEDAEDLAQETLYRIFANRGRYDPSRDFKPWALTIMANIYKTQLARRACVPFVGIDQLDCAYSSMRADDVALLHDAMAAVRESAARSVGVECVMLYANGYSYEEIARMVGINPGTVKSRISAGRKLIRSYLDR